MIDWTNPDEKISKYFTVKEATYLPSWGVCHTPSDSEKKTLSRTAAIMDIARERVGLPFHVHVWIRPTQVNCPDSPHHGEDYNAFVGGARHSGHILCMAVDFDCGENCDNTRATLEPMLSDLGLRMEKKPGGNWVHLDICEVPPGGHRYFFP